VDDEVLVAMVRNTPIEPPFEHWKTLRTRQWRKRLRVIEPKHRLSGNPPPYAQRSADAHVEIDKRLVGLNRVLRVVKRDTALDRWQWRPDVCDERSGPQTQAALLHALR